MNTRDIVGGGAIATSVGSVAGTVGIAVALTLFAFVLYKIAKAS